MKVMMFSFLLSLSFISIPEASASTYLQCMINATKNFRDAKTIFDNKKKKEVSRCEKTPMDMMKRVSCLLKADTAHKAEVRILETKRNTDYQECKMEFGR